MVLVISRDSLVSGGRGECRNIRRNMPQGGLFSSNNHALLTKSLQERKKKAKPKTMNVLFPYFRENAVSYKLSYSDSDLCLTGSLEANAVLIMEIWGCMIYYIYSGSASLSVPLSLIPTMCQGILMFSLFSFLLHSPVVFNALPSQ